MPGSRVPLHAPLFSKAENKEKRGPENRSAPAMNGRKAGEAITRQEERSAMFFMNGLE
jgi:hypothetical protein